MVDLVKVVELVRDDLKAEYLRDRTAVWAHPFVGFITDDDFKQVGNAKDEAQIVAWLREFREPNKMKGVVVGRMVAKYSQTIRDQNGDPQITERAILVSGRIIDSDQTYVTITPCKEHKDLRLPEHGEPLKDRPFIPGITSPDKVDPIVNAFGEVSGFVEMQFGKEQVFDSRRGEMCMLDPIIEGVVGPQGIVGTA